VEIAEVGDEDAGFGEEAGWLPVDVGPRPLAEVLPLAWATRPTRKAVDATSSTPTRMPGQGFDLVLELISRAH
jgi:hypothetical protein